MQNLASHRGAPRSTSVRSKCLQTSFRQKGLFSGGEHFSPKTSGEGAFHDFRLSPHWKRSHWIKFTPSLEDSVEFHDLIFRNICTAREKTEASVTKNVWTESNATNTSMKCSNVFTHVWPMGFRGDLTCQTLTSFFVSRREYLRGILLQNGEDVFLGLTAS